jgi:hypothetical protein
MAKKTENDPNDPQAQPSQADPQAPPEPQPTVTLAETTTATFGVGGGPATTNNDDCRRSVDLDSWPPAPLRIGPIDVNPVDVHLQEASTSRTSSQAFWTIIQKSTEALSFADYEAFVSRILCGDADYSKTPYLLNGVDGYPVLKAATEAFLMHRCASLFDFKAFQAEASRFAGSDPGDLVGQLNQYLGDPRVLPYIKRISDGLLEIGTDPFCDTRAISDKIKQPCALELIWSYWNEQGYLVQAINAISLRFQNKRGAGDREPLVNLEMHPLRPLSHILWGYIQDEDHRLTVARRVYEYRHEYGLELRGRAVSTMRVADDRSKFLAAFNSLLRQASVFYERASNLTIRADAFPLLNSLREVHLILAEGAHNQFRDLTWTARAEMLMQQWILSRREMREFLGARAMVPYPEPWMGVVDSLKRMMGWTDTSVTHFRDLAVNGERIVLSIRYGDWSVINNENEARAWVQFFKPEIQTYINAYHAVTGVDLAAMPVSTSSRAADATSPAILIQQQMARQRR